MPSFARICAALLSVLLIVNVAHSQGDVTSNLGLRVTAASSNNIRRQSASGPSTAYRGAGIFFANRRNGSRIDTAFAGDVDFREYSDDLIADERVGSVNATLNVDVVPNIFSWFFDDSYGQGRINPFIVASPTNRQDVNIFSTGPRFTAPVGNRNLIQASATSTRSRFDNTNQLDSDAETVQLGVFREISPVTDIGLTASNREITYNNNPLLTWEVRLVAINYQRQLARGSTSIQVGRNSMDFGTVERTSPMLDFRWTRRLGARSVFSLDASQNESDPGAAFARANVLLGPAGIGGANVFLGAGVFEFRDVNVRTTFNYDRTTMSISLGVAQSDYETVTTFDNDQRRAAFNVTREISTRMQLGVNLDLLDREFLSADRTDRDQNARLWFSRTFSRRFSMQFSYQRWKRSSRGLNPFDEDMYQASFLIDLL